MDNVEFGNGLVLHADLNKNAHNKIFVGLGDSKSLIEICITDYDGHINSIDCINPGLINNTNISLPKTQNLKNEIFPVYFPTLYKDSYETQDKFIFYFDENEVNIVIREDEITSYYKDGRVELYYNTNSDLTNIVINNLSESEYKFLLDIKEKGVDEVIDTNPYENKEEKIK